jgi:hypothetical protein
MIVVRRSSRSRASSCCNIYESHEPEYYVVEFFYNLDEWDDLHLRTCRLGVDAVVVLEQSKSLRNEGAALTLFPNAWRVLDALDVADVLRPHFINIMG